MPRAAVYATITDTFVRQRSLPAPVITTPALTGSIPAPLRRLSWLRQVPASIPAVPNRGL